MASLLDLLTGGQGQGILGNNPFQQGPSQAQPQPQQSGNGFGNFVNNNPLTLLALGAGIAKGGIGGMGEALPAAQFEQGQQKTLQAQQALYNSIKQAGGSEAQARAGALNPEAFKAFAPDLFGSPKLVKVGSNPITGDQFMMQHGGKLLPLSSAMPEGAETGGSGTGSGMLAAGVKYDPNLQGEDYLNQFSPEVKAAVKAYIRGDVMPTGNPRQQGIASTAKTIAQKYGMDTGEPVSDVTYAARRKMQTDLAASAPNSMGGILANGKSAFSHLANLTDKFVDLGNKSGPDIPGGAHIGTMENYVGNVLAPTAATKGKIVAVNDNALKYGQEATKYYAGTGGGEAERMNALKVAKAETSTGEEQASFAETEKQLMLERLSQKEAQIRDVMGQKYLDEHPVRTPDLQKSIEKIDVNIARLRGGAPSSASAAVPAPGQPAPAAAGNSGWTVKRIQQ